MKALGYIAYEGPSQIDGRPIVVIVNKLAGSANAKTGADLVQTFIIRADVAPTDALKTGADVSICGQCVHRPILAISYPVMQLSVGKLEDLQGIFDVCVSVPHTVRASALEIGMMRMAGILSVFKVCDAGRIAARLQNLPD